MNRQASWSGQQLAEFLATVSSYRDERSAVDGGVERAAEALDAEVGAVMRRGAVVSSVGFPRGRVPARELEEAASGHRGTLDVPGVGPVAVLVVPLDGGPATALVLGRSGDGFTKEETILVRGMGRVLSLVLHMLGVLEDERALRRESDRHADENARLVASLQERQALIERLFKIQRSISHRAPIQEVLDAITEGAAELLGDEIVGLRLIDDRDHLRMASSVGIGPETLDSVRYTPVDEGLAGQALAEGRLIVSDDYGASGHAMSPFVAEGVQAAMAAPVHQDGRPVGCLVVASHRKGRRYESMEQEVLLAFAEHASLALNDAGAVEGLRKAFADAVHQANHDALTGLPNRTLVLDRLSRALGRTGEEGRVAVLFVDLDRFKMVNDTLGHSVGDEVLIRVAERLSAAVRPLDTVGRLAGDEFVVVCEDVRGVDVGQLAERVARAVAQPLPLYGRDTVITASIGIVHAPAGSRADEVLRDADVAMYRAKERGRSRIEVFDQAIRTQMLERLETEHSLRRSLQEGRLRLDYQPIVSAATGDLVAVEALVRWERPGRGLVGPDQFIPVAEETGLIVPMGHWVLSQACSQLGAWRAHPSARGLQVSVNLSARQFADPGLVVMVADALARAGIPPAALALEITESVLMEEAAATAETLSALKELGVRVSIDDFGTGYSSLSYLKRFPVDVLKVDRSFVRGLGADGEDRAIVTAVIGLAHALDLTVVAEGVESEVQLRELRRLSCDAVQGYLLGRPQGPAELERRLFRPTASRPQGADDRVPARSGDGGPSRWMRV